MGAACKDTSGEWELDLGSIIQANIDRLKELLK
jgi:hypothetical protein